MGVNTLLQRSDIPRARCIVIKIGSSSLTKPDGSLNFEYLERLVDAVAVRRARGHNVVIVSSGAIAAGIGPLRLNRRPVDLATSQATAAVGQVMLIADYARLFSRHDQSVGQVLLTAEDLIRRQHYRNARRALNRLLELGVVPIVNENDAVATDEIRFGDNDRLAALVANLVSAELLLLLTDVEGLYTARPSEPGAQLVTHVKDMDELEDYSISGRGTEIGTGGMATKIDAAMIAAHSGVPTLLASAERIEEALRGAPVGTWFSVADHRRSSRRLWLAWAARTQGHVVLDDGAVRAVTTGKKSLLAAGITGVVGTFESGEPIELLDLRGNVVARGLSGYDSSEVVRMLGRSTAQLRVELGDDYARPVVHRDELAPARPGRQERPPNTDITPAAARATLSS